MKLRAFLVFFITIFVLVSKVFPMQQGRGADFQGVEVITGPEHEAARAMEYLKRIVDDKDLWVSKDDTLRLSIQRLVTHFNEPFDSIRARLEKYEFGKIKAELKSITLVDTLPLRWLNETTFIVDTVRLDQDPMLTRKTLITRVIDPGSLATPEKLLEDKDLLERTFKVIDTIIESVVDTYYFESRNIKLHSVERGRIVPSLLPPQSPKSVRFTPDFQKAIVSEPVEAYFPVGHSPFFKFHNTESPDSIANAVETLLQFTMERDSILIHLNDNQGRKMPVWLSTGSDRFQRYWVKNANNDSISVWVGNPSWRDIVMILEDEVFIERVSARRHEGFQLLSAPPRRTLARVTPMKELPRFWTTGFVGSMTLNQNYLSNWARGGTSSISGLIDVLFRARYNNTEHKTNWENSAQLRFGTIRTKDNDRVMLRTSTDILELNSKFNKQLFGKFDFSSIFYFRTQVAKAYRQPQNEQLVSKFLNPGTFTVGMGFEYRPFKGSSINFSLLSYRNTFVLDTLNINQTSFGIDKDSKSRQEMGGQLLIRNAFDITEDLKVTNSLRLFSNYLKNPEKVDVNWELGITQRISWFFSVRFNFHLIYDDKIKFPRLENGEPVLLPDGSPEMVPKAQINQLLGLTFSLTL